jgi:Ca2+-binding RTX toxin-like protein
MEAANEGLDTVYSSISYSLGANVENLVLTGTDAIGATGNELANWIEGNASDNTLDGGAGTDALLGGGGNDIYRVDDANDLVIEAAGAGIDTVYSTVSTTLADNVENLVLAGTAALNGTGNAEANWMEGNGAANVLTGGAGNDALIGGGGADTLDGGAGDDTYYFGRGGGDDLLVETGTSAGDVAQFGTGIAIDQLWFTQAGSDLRVQVIGTSDFATVGNWYAASGTSRLDVFKTSDGYALQEAQVQNLVNAMAAYSPPPPGQTTLSPEYQSALAPTIAANWQ